MCGIAGMVYPSSRGTPDTDVLRRMNARIKHRGPDDEGYYKKGPAALAMRRLKIIDLEGGHQPVCDESGTVWTVFNGEIYNFQELRRQLEAKGHRFKSRSDTEVIVHLYEEHGADFVQALRGMFAIALWDEKKQQLYLFRDRLGIKPLYYAFQGGQLIFGSELKSVLEHPGLDLEISTEALYDYLSYLYIPAPKSIYRGILKLPPAHGLRWHAGKIEVYRYWDVDYRTEQGVPEDVWCKRILAELEESIRLHKISDVPLGSFLSGGIDSSAVSSLLACAEKTPVKTYSIGFETAGFNELPYARQVANRIRSDHHEKIVNPDALELLPQILEGFDEPFGDSSAIPTYLVSQFARRDVTVALSGDGGDELFGGYGWTQKELWLEKYRALPGPMRRALQGILNGRDYAPLAGGGKWETLRRFIFDAGRTPLESFERRVRCFQPWMLERLCRPGTWETLRGRSVLAEHEARVCHADTLSRLLYLDSTVYLPDDLLTKVDRMSMAHSLEVRVPLLDHKVVELAARIPSSLKFKGRTTKYIFKKALAPYLPPEILKQRKHGFSLPVNAWFRGELKAAAEALLLESGSRLHEYFQPESLQELLKVHQSKTAAMGPQIYALMVLELWLRGRENPAALDVSVLSSSRKRE